jgi:hypothetical protein
MAQGDPGGKGQAGLGRGTQDRDGSLRRTTRRELTLAASALRSAQPALLIGLDRAATRTVTGVKSMKKRASSLVTKYSW